MSSLGDRSAKKNLGPRKSSFQDAKPKVNSAAASKGKPSPKPARKQPKGNLLVHKQQEKPKFDKDATKKFDDMLDGDLSDLPPLPKSMVRIFLSSTFSDMRAERNALARVVYPDLREYCAAHDLDFQVVDMRWGITEDSINDHSVEKLCLLEVKNCQKLSVGPNFIVLAGDRYGFRPIPVELDTKMFEILRYEATKLNLPDRTLLDDWYKLDNNSVPPVYVLQPIRSKFTFFADFSPECDELRKKDTADWWKTFEALQGILRKSSVEAFKEKKISDDEAHQFFNSVTECEIQEGILNAEEVSSHCLVYRREFQGFEGSALLDKEAPRYMDVKQTEKGVQVDQEVMKLKVSLAEKIRKKLSKSNIKEYQIYWMPQGVDPDETKEHHKYIRRFCDDFYTDCQMLIEKAMSEKAGKIMLSNYYSDYDDTVHHLKFCLSKCESFCGQEKVLAAAKKYILDQSTRKPLILHAESGHGKTAIMAMIMKSISGWIGNKPHFKLIRFLGTSPLSNNIYDVLFGVLGQLSDAYDLIISPINYRNIKKLVEFTPRYLRQVANKVNEPIFILLDSLDQLYSHYNAYSMDWLPLLLPPNVKLIVSTLPREHGILENLKERLPDQECYIEVPVLTESAGKLIIETYLKRSKRKLTSEQMQLLLSTFSQAPSPLFLKLLVDEAIKWNSYTPKENLELAPTVKAAINRLFQNLENKFGLTLISHTLGYITVGLSGLTVFEIEDVLSCDDEVLNEVYKYHDPPVPGIVRIPPVLLARINYDIREYLVERMAHGKHTLNWYHRQFIETAAERYLQKGKPESLHQNLMTVFHQEEGYKSTVTLSNRKSLKIENADRQVTPQPYTVHNRRKLACLPYHTLKCWRLIGVQSAKANVYLSYKFLCTRIAASGVSTVCSDLKDFVEETGDEEVKMMLHFLQVSKDNLSNNTRFAVCVLANINPQEEHQHLKALHCQAREFLATKTKPLLIPDFPCLAPRLDASSAYETSLQGYSNILACSGSGLLLEASAQIAKETDEGAVELKSGYAIFCSESQNLLHNVFEGLDVIKQRAVLCDQHAFFVTEKDIVRYNVTQESTEIFPLSGICPSMSNGMNVDLFVSGSEEEKAVLVSLNKIILIDLRKMEFVQQFEISNKPAVVENAFLVENAQILVTVGRIDNSAPGDLQGPENQSFICVFEQGKERPMKSFELEVVLDSANAVLAEKERWIAVPTKYEVSAEEPKTEKSVKVLVYRVCREDCKREIEMSDRVIKMHGHPDKMQLAALTEAGRVYSIKFYELSDKADVLVVMLKVPVVDFTIDWDNETGFLCSGGGKVTMYDFKSDRNLGAFSAHPTVIREIMLLEKELFTLSASDELKVWSVSTLYKDAALENVGTVQSGETLLDQVNVTAVMTTSDGKDIITCHEDETAKIWSLQTQSLKFHLKIGLVADLVHILVEEMVAFHDTVNGKVKILDLSTGDETVPLPDSLQNIMHSVPSKTGEILYIISAPKKGKERIDAVNIPLGKISKTIHLQSGLTYENIDIFLSATEEYLVIRHRISENEFETIKAMWKKGGFGEQNHRYRFTAVSVAQGTGALIPCFRHQCKIPLLGVYVQPYRGSTMLVSTRRWLVFWDIPTGKCDQKPAKIMKTGMFYRPEWLGQNCKGVSEVFAQTADQKFVVTGSEDGTVFVYNATTGIPVGNTKPTTRHSAEVHRLALSPDSHWVASSCRSSVLKLWDCATGTEQFSMRLDAEVQSMHFTPDSHKLVLFTGTFTTRVLVFTVFTDKKGASQ